MEVKNEEIEAEVLESSNKNNIMDRKTKKEMIKKEMKKYNDYNSNINGKKNNKNNKFLIIALITLILVLLIAAFCTIFSLINLNNDKILGGITIRNSKVEGLTEREAIETVRNSTNEEKKQEMKLKINGDVYPISLEQIDVQYDVEKAVEKAYSIGRKGNIIENNFEILRTMFEENKIDIDITYNEQLLENLLKEIEAKLPNVMTDNTYDVEEEERELVITRGTSGIVIDLADAKNTIIDKIKNGDTEEIEIKTVFKECPEIDIEKIYSEVKTEPQNATYKKDPFEIIPHKNGLDFNLDEAKIILSEEKDEYVIKLNIIEPEIHTNEIGEEAFPDLLGSFSTKYDATNLSRSNNLVIAMKKLNGTVVMPGEVFSYNKTLGKRTVEEGYQDANGFAGGKVVPMLAGGICQISSTLYDAALYANMNIVERHNHMFQATYVDPGKDATVVYGSLDFKFENTRKYPIMIKTKCGSGLAEIKIFGIKEEVEYEIEILSVVQSYTPYKVVYEDDSSLAPGVERVSQYGLQGCKSTTYRIRKLNGQEVSKEVLSTDVYDPLNKIIRRGVRKQVQQPVETTTEPDPITTPVEAPVETPVEPTTPVVEEPIEQTPPPAELPVQPQEPEVTENAEASEN